MLLPGAHRMQKGLPDAGCGHGLCGRYECAALLLEAARCRARRESSEAHGCADGAGALPPQLPQGARRHPEADRLFGEKLELLHGLEEAHCASIDRTADAFASLLKGCADFFPEEKERRAAELLLYHVGRFLYLADALDDLPKDAKSGSYNPLIYRYCLKDGALPPEDKAQLLETMDASIGLAASALELLPPRTDGAILTNIIYYGLPAVLHSVAEGTFCKRSKK